MPAPRENQTQQKEAPAPLTRTLLVCPFLPTTAAKPTIPHLPTIHSYRHHTRRATVSAAHLPHHTQKARMAACLSSAFYTWPRWGRLSTCRQPPQKNKQHPRTSALPSSRSRRQFILQTPICQTKRQSVLWKAHTSFYVISNPPGEQPHQGVFSCSINQNPKNTCCHPQETLQGNLFDNPLGHAARACPHIAASEPQSTTPPHDKPPRRALLVSTHHPIRDKGRAPFFPATPHMPTLIDEPDTPPKIAGKYHTEETKRTPAYPKVEG